MIVRHDDPQYSHFNPASCRPYTLFKSVYTNNTDRPQEYSFKTERSTESLATVCREQGYMIGTEAELTLKTPCKFVKYIYFNYALRFYLSFLHIADEC